MAVGLVTGVLISNQLPDPYTRVTALAFCALGSILPDIDHPDSVVGRKLWPLSWIINEIFGHRGFIHSIFLASLMLATAIFLKNPLEIYLVVGWWTHLVCDSVTIVGIPYFRRGADFRLPRRMRIRTGSVTETGVVQLYVIFALVLTVLTAI